MDSYTQTLERIRKELDHAIAHATTEAALEAVRIAYLGRQGEIIQLTGLLKNFSLEHKQAFGPLFNALRDHAQSSILAHKEVLLQKAADQLRAQHAHFDVTANLTKKRTGSLHPFTQSITVIEDIFMSMGFKVVEGPEIETPEYNFDALNIGPNHPARQMHDTFWLDLPNRLLRTHTSTVQIHAMRAAAPPLAILAPGRVYRHEATDATHDFMFLQVEGLLIDKGISIAHLLSILKTCMQALFNLHSLDIRVRPSYFPFVEPGLEVDISCPFCTTGCSTCKKTRWIEIGGAGLVHPNVLRAVNIDPSEYSGCAFGLGIERLAMLRYKIDDIRLFRSGSVDFLKQF